ncbi:hypothetical protein HX109_00465 [Galbibacter sp. BG1]|uniref:hypothetical protein n=1 Tax=Galbibacter sp. BG1 TaxID=1170699 RepID=UPI0015B89126|nr:hypothetical protein [Galbibacter sp. BG1]QLE00104.1 hypothetical protein HX109_00465 [Galbibacter sp. BG1]
MKKFIYSALWVCCTLLFFSCSKDESVEDTTEVGNNPLEDVELSAATSVTDNDGNTYEVGFNQVSNINQDPFVRKRLSSGESIWYVEHEKSEVDGRATMILVDNNNVPWVVFSLVGGSYSEDYLTKRAVEGGAFNGVYQGGYGNGGGPKVSIIAKLNPNTGKIEKASFITARKNDGKTNGFNVKKIGFKEGKLAFQAASVAWPPGKGKSYQKFPDITDADRVDGVFSVYYEMNPTLTEITEAVLLK